MISIVIPVYRSEKSLKELYERIKVVFEKNIIEFEIIFVEDYGGDNSWEIIKTLANKDKRIKGIKFSRNFGQHNAILCGIREASGEITVTMDDDLQHLPEELPKIIDKLKQGFDVVYGPPLEEMHGIFRNTASKVTKYALENVIGASNARNVTALRVFRTKLRESFSDYSSPVVNIDVLLSWVTINYGVEFVKYDIRKFGRSAYTFRKLLRHAITMLTGFSIKPLQISTWIGFLFIIFGKLILTYVVIKWMLYGSSTPGFAFLASIISIFAGAQLFTLGIIGEYLGAIHLKSMNKPQYVKKEEI
jgi:glycosyltransferase involved in cell wall biosynthesis